MYQDISCGRKLTQCAEVVMVLLVEASGLALPRAPQALHRVIAAFRQGHESYLVTRRLPLGAQQVVTSPVRELYD